MKLVFVPLNHKVAQPSLQRPERRDEESKELFSSLQSQTPSWLGELMRRKTQWEVYGHNSKYFSSTKQHVFHLLLSVLKEIDGNSEQGTLIRILMLALEYGFFWLSTDIGAWKLTVTGRQLKTYSTCLEPLMIFHCKKMICCYKNNNPKKIPFFSGGVLSPLKHYKVLAILTLSQLILYSVCETSCWCYVKAFGPTQRLLNLTS